MIHEKEFPYAPFDDEREKASNSYVMSLLAVMVGLPLPIINLIATFIFYLGNKNGTYFVRWHSTQALLSQFSLMLLNSISMYWTISIFFWDQELTNVYFGYIFSVFLYNLTEFIITVYTAIGVRKGRHLEWYFFGPLTNQIVKA